MPNVANTSQVSDTNDSPMDEPTPKKRSPLKMIPMLLGIILLVAAVGAAITFYFMYAKTKQELVSAKANPQQLADVEAQALIAKVGRLVDLPTDEQPTIATVASLEQLKDQPFFAKAKVGDKVLIYPIAKRAYLYDPVADKILEIGPIADAPEPGVAGISTEEATQAAFPAPSLTPTPFPTATLFPTQPPLDGQSDPNATPTIPSAP